MKLTIKTKYNNLTTVQKVPHEGGFRGAFFASLLLLVGTSASFAQVASYTLTQPDNVSKTYEARDYIHLKPGYSFSSAGGKVLHLKINQYMAFPTSYQSQPPSSTRNLITSYAVGTIAGGASVSPSGGAVYQIPIEVMPGTGGMQPNVSISYNSQSGNGLLGYGWNLGAVSAITRVGKTIYHDGVVGAPDSTTNDNLTLDGQRLMRASGTNLAASSTYKTEIESYLTITCKSLGGYLGFEVKNKEGWTMEYGSTADSYVKPKNGGFAYAWLLKKATDANGNYMTYTYDTNAETGEFRLVRIDYTGNTAAGLTPYNKIEFFYDLRTDKSKSYIAGRTIEQNAILKKIKCSAYNEVIREYQFNYFYDGFVSKLTEVVEFGQNGMRYNSTVVEWDGNTKTGKEYSPTFISSGAPYPLYSDFNGDGIADIIWISDPAPSSSSRYVSVYAFDGITGLSPLFSMNVNTDFHKFISGDFDGDGKMDLVRVRKSGNNYLHDYFFSSDDWFAAGSFSTSSDEVYVGDFDGDGKQDILTKVNTMYKAGAITTTPATGITWGMSAKVSVADFNGNGKSDVLVTNNSGFTVYEFNGSAFSPISSSTEIISSSTNKFLLGDFNGDGKTDILVKQNTTYFILFSTGTGFEKKTLPNLNVAEWYAGDFNRDGKTDIVFTQSNPFAIKLALSDGNTLQVQNENYTSPYITATNADKLSVADFDGDGFSEVFLQVTPNTLAIKAFANSQKLFVKTIVNGLNQKTTFTYNPITNNMYYGASTTTYNFPMSTFQQPLYVVTQMSRQLTPIITDTETYYYKGTRMHKQGKGFLGFEEVTVTNANQNRKTTTKYGYNPTYYNVYPTQQKVTTTSNLPISQTDFINSNYVSFSPKVIFPYVSSQTITDNLTGLSKTVNYYYNSTDHGNPSQITETQGSLITITYYTWEAKNNTYKNRVTQQATLRSGIGQSFSEAKTFAYDAKARLTQTVDFSNNPSNAVTTTYSNFDNFGNPQTVTTTAANCLTCPDVETNATFDATGRFPLTSTDALGNTSSATYDNKTGALLSQTDIAGQTTYYQYDGFGRCTQASIPTDVISYGLVWDTSNGNLYKSTVTSQVTGTQTTWYNAAGLETKRQVPGFLNNTIITENEYNPQGQLTKSYLPNYGSKGGQFVEYTYDPYGRIATEINIHSSRTTYYTYSGLTTSVKTPDNQTRSTTLNSSGLVVRSTDNAGTVEYTYNSLGKPESITSVGAKTTIKYDTRGFQTELHDPNLAKAIKYEYDAYGQLIKQTNARDDITTYQYDAAGRITTETIPGRTLTYQYETLGGGIGQIKSIKENGNTVRSYSYNSFGQPLTVIETIDVPYTTSYTYNTKGQMLTKTSPSGLTISYGYDTNGFLNSLKNAANNTPIWTLNAMNALGQITKTTQGNDLTRSVGYDSYHLPSKIILRNGTINPPIDSIVYAFNGITGNLTTRNDITNSKNETFGYDNLNRLTTITGGKSISYYNNGNINVKSDVGTYAYTNGKPHAVSDITLNPTTAQAGMTHDITNTSYNRVSKIEQQGVKKVEFTYNPDNQRNKATYYEGTTTPLPLKKTTYYVGNYEKIVNVGGTTEENDYIYTPDGMSAIAKKIGGATTFYYVNTDHLGSIRTITKADKMIETRYVYDAWGVQDKKTTNPSITTRGYTGHEHLTEFGLINMNARMYDPVLGRFLEADPYVQEGDYTQSYNRYSYCLNNPLIYTDPDGEFFFIVPSVGWSKSGGWNVGITAIWGIPGVASVQVGAGYSFKNEDFNVFAGATAAFNTVYVNYSTQSDWSVGWSAGLSPQMGFPVSTNFTTVGVNYNITHKAWSGNVSSWSISEAGIDFNPSASVMLFPEHTTNFVRGKGFRSNEKVYDMMMRGNYSCQDIIDYFGFKGTYDPAKAGGKDARTNTQTRETFYGNGAFNDGFNHLSIVAYHEMKHVRRLGKYGGEKLSNYDIAKEDYIAFRYNYRNQGLYPNYDKMDGVVREINDLGRKIGIHSNVNRFEPQKWHFIYKIPRKW